MLLPFVKEGLEMGEMAFHTVDPKRREEHIHWLTSAGIDVASQHDHGQIEVSTWTETHLRKGLFDQDETLAFWGKVVSEAKSKGFPVVRFVTQMGWALETGIDVNELLEYEAKANESWFHQDGPFNHVICVYDLRKFRGDVVVDVMRTHPLLIIGGVLHENPFFVPPEEFLREVRKRRVTRTISSSTAV